MDFIINDTVSILFAGETGNSEEVAYEISSKLNTCGIRNCVFEIGTYDVMKLPSEHFSVFITATSGDGEPPTSMKKFWNFLLRKSLASDSLAGLRHAVFGLGDSSYDKYNLVGRKLERRLQQLGSQPMIPLGLGDDQSSLGYLSALDPWREELISILQSFNLASNMPLNNRNIDPNAPVVDENILHRVTYLDSYGAEDSDAAMDTDVVERVRSLSDLPQKFHERSPFFNAVVVENKRLTANVWAQDVRHVKLDLALQNRHLMNFEGPLYLPGDVAEVFYKNGHTIVQQALKFICSERCLSAVSDGGIQCTPDTVVDIRLISERNSRASRLGNLGRCSLKTLLEQYLDIGAVPKRSYFAALAPYATDPEQSAKLLELSGPGGTDLYFDYCIRERKTYIEVLEEFHSCRPPLELLLGVIQVIVPRLYSIASSPLIVPSGVGYLLFILVVDLSFFLTTMLKYFGQNRWNFV
jgi:sulfite reductase alpha subunit-like flavoprotein